MSSHFAHSSGPRCRAVGALLLLFGASLAAPAQAGEGDPSAASSWGGAGPRALDAAHSLASGSLVVTLGAQMFYAQSLLQPGDSDLATYEVAALAWTPLPGFDVGLSAAFSTNTYAWLATIQRQSFGNPAVHLKYGHEVAPDWVLGVALHARAPTAQNSGSIVPSAGSLQAQALLSWLPLPGLEFLFNGGYILDRSASLASDLTNDGRFALDINGNRVNLGLAALKQWDLGDTVSLSPFVEVTGYVAPGVPSKQNAGLVTLGLKALFVRQIEVSLGADARLFGAPQPAAAYAGLPPWRVFALASVRFAVGAGHSPTPEPPASASKAAGCAVDTDCQKDEVCHVSRCVLVEMHQAPALALNPNVPPTFRLTGKVVDASTNRPLPEAQLRLGGFDTTLLAVDPHTGAFTSWPLPAAGGALPVEATAPGYKPLKQVLRRNANGNDVPLTIALQPSDQVIQGVLRGTLTNADDGTPVADAQLFLPRLHRKFGVDGTGSFTLPLARGRYDVIFSAKGFISQRRRFLVREGDVVIVNGELRPRHRRSSSSSSSSSADDE